MLVLGRAVEVAQLVLNVNSRKMFQHHVYISDKMKRVLQSAHDVYIELVELMDPKNGKFTDESDISLYTRAVLEHSNSNSRAPGAH
jgi:hypothetical protein